MLVKGPAFNGRSEHLNIVFVERDIIVSEFLALSTKKGPELNCNRIGPCAV